MSLLVSPIPVEIVIPVYNEERALAGSVRKLHRCMKRELISRSYNILLRVSLGVGFSDAQCGFKAARRETLVPLLERVEDDAWFFDTELLYRAERSKLAIHEVPVRWVDDPDSRVEILATAREDLRGIRRLRRAAAASRREAATNAGPHAVTTPATTISGSWPGTTVKPSSRIARRRSAERAC
jgi:hypothetical protein